MKINRVLVLLILIFIAGSLIRLYPAAVSEVPLRYDNYYHIRAAELIQQTGDIPSYEPWPFGGRPHLYPPLYHISLVAGSAVLGASVLDVSRFFLPLVSSLTTLVIFWFVRKFRNETTALLASMFFALNPYLISSAYESPQVIGIMLSLFAIYFMLRNKYWHSGIVLAVMYFFNTFIALIISLPIVLLLLSEKRFRELAMTVIPLAIAISIWYLPRLELFQCSNLWLGPHFISKTADGWMKFNTPVFLSMFLISVSLLTRLGDRYRRFWLMGTVAFFVLFLSHYITPLLHPWRQDSMLMLGLVFIFAEALSKLNKKKLFFLVIFAAASLFALSAMYSTWLFDRPFTESEYALINYTASLPAGVVPLANHDLCANIMTLTGKQCLLDINFECIPDESLWYDYEQVFWANDYKEMRYLLEKREVDAVAFASNDWTQPFIAHLDANKKYAAWLPGANDAAFYETNIRDGTLSYYGRYS